jgi:hypothetical protein
MESSTCKRSWSCAVENFVDGKERGGGGGGGGGGERGDLSGVTILRPRPGTRTPSLLRIC